ncbi:hypothetical protein B0A49_13192 [Cryomyces minteri]|uniref:DNA-directed DNA polymerase n=1 Tax=Cryomyces minteri TaxID=331657 RepID=A0A4V5NAT5_9PEZI|nr:hypothetical protein B0A49_13192 [Cryomyces minteri]
MADDPPSSPTLRGSSPTLRGTSSPVEAKVPQLDLSVLPLMFVLSTHLDTEDLHELEDRLVEHGARLTYKPAEAKLVLGKVNSKARAALDLRCRRVWTEEVKAVNPGTKRHLEAAEPSRKRRRVERVPKRPGEEDKVIVIDDSSTESEAEVDARVKPEPASQNAASVLPTSDCHALSSMRQNSVVGDCGDTIKVVKLEWYEDSVKAGRTLALEKYTVYEGRPIERPATTATPQPSDSSRSTPKLRSNPSVSQAQKVLSEITQSAKDILERAKAEAPSASQPFSQTPHKPADRTARKFGNRNFVSKGHTFDRDPGVDGSNNVAQPPHLLLQTTSEHAGDPSSDIPDPPLWVKRNIKYACQRVTPPNPPNDSFIELLKKIKLARLLTDDEIGVRAYNSSIAALAAYPYPLTSAREILGIPCCDVKIANLWVEFKNTGRIKAVDDAEEDETMQVLRLFYEIWGVGAATAREFYFGRGWRVLDDIVEYGWATLSRVQQIGVKYYDEFLEKISRTEVESIASIIHKHAIRVRDDRIKSVVVGGYRRGKTQCGDVDIIVSHRDEKQTLNLVTDVVASLEEEGWVTHTLLLSLTNSKREQETLPYRTGGGVHGFDTLDKALVVWQDPSWPTKTADLAANPKAKNQNIHRRVDIIVSPWRTVGCAVAGWTSGTTFQRDLRRYAKNVKSWKFDSSGVRDRVTGEIVDVERFNSDEPAESMEEAEKRVFEGLGLEWREPWERCTG